MELGQPIAEGRTAEIYAWRDGMVLKLFRDWMSAEAVDYEVRIARAVCVVGVVAPQAGEVVTVGDRLGIEYEHLDGKTMGDVMQHKPWLFLRYARQLAELHVAIHNVKSVPDIPTHHERLTYKIKAAKDLPSALQEAALEALAQMPKGNRLCHGDFHPWNVMLTDKGSRAIDWVDASLGVPLSDVARTTVLLDGVRKMTEPVTWLEKLLLGWYCRAYLKRYFELRPGGEVEYHRWYPIVAAARMSEDIPGLNPWLRKQVEIGLMG